MNYASKSLAKLIILNFLYWNYSDKQKKLVTIISRNLSISRVSEFRRELSSKTPITLINRKQKFCMSYRINFLSTKISMWSNSIKNLVFLKVWSKKLERSNWSCQNLVKSWLHLKERKYWSAIFQYLRWSISKGSNTLGPMMGAYIMIQCLK